MNRRDALRASSALLLASCSRPGASAAGGKVNLALNWVAEPEFGGFYAARETGAFTRAGLDVEILGGGAGAPVIQQISSGRVEFGTVGGDEIVNGNMRGTDVVPIFATFQTSPVAIMVHASTGATSMADALGGGTLAVEPGAAFAVFLKKKYGFDRLRVVPYDGGVARFVADKTFRQQCFVTSEPIAAKKLGADVKTFMVSDEGYNPYSVIATRRALWREKPDLVRAFVNAIREGWRAYLDDPKPANVAMAKVNSTLDAATFDAMAAVQRPLIETAETGREKLGLMTRQRWEAFGKQLFELGVIDHAPPPVDYLVSM